MRTASDRISGQQYCIWGAESTLALNPYTPELKTPKVVFTAYISRKHSPLFFKLGSVNTGSFTGFTKAMKTFLSHDDEPKKSLVCKLSWVIRHTSQVSAVEQCSLTGALGRAACRRKGS